MKKFFLPALTAIFIVTIFSQTKAYAGAWTNPKDNVYLEFYNKFAKAQTRYDSNWKKTHMSWDEDNQTNKGGKWWAYDFEFKAEYGLADWFTLMFALPYEVSEYKEYERPADWGPYKANSDGIKYVTVGGKIRLTQQPMVVSFQMLGSIANPGAKNLNPSIGGGDDKLELRVLLGKSYKIWRLPSYSGFETGYRFRGFHKVSDDIPMFFETGVVLLDWLMATFELDTWTATGNTHVKTSSGIVRGGFIISPTGKFNQFRQSKNHINIGVQGGYTVWGQDTNAAWEIVLKVSTQFDLPQLVNGITSSNHPKTREVTHN